MPSQYDKNCFAVTHRTSSIIICAIGFAFLVTALVTVCVKPRMYQYIFGIGLSDQSYLISVLVFVCTFTVMNIFLALSLYYEGPALMMVYLVGNALCWNMFLVLWIAIGIITGTRSKRHELYESGGTIALRLIMLFLALVVWLIFVILVGRHWFALCEEILHQMEEQDRRVGLGARTGSSIGKRMRSMSVFSRYKRTDDHGSGHGRLRSSSRRKPSTISQRMPTFMKRFEKSPSEKDKFKGWGTRPKPFEIERSVISREPGTSSPSHKTPSHHSRHSTTTSERSLDSPGSSTIKVEKSKSDEHS